VSRCFHNTASFTTIVCNQTALPGIKAFGLVENPLVETALAEGFPPGLFCSLGFFEGDDFCHGITIVIPAKAGTQLLSV